MSGRLQRLRPELELRNPDAQAPAWLRLAIVGVGLAIAVLLLGLVADPGADPYGSMWRSTLGSTFGVNQVIMLATPLILAGCAVAIARRAGLWNIGVDGQLLFGAWVATAFVFAFPDLPPVVLVPVMLLMGMIGGMLWVAVPAVLYAYFRVNEVVTTLLLNFVAASWVLYWVTGPWTNEGVQGSSSVTSKPIPSGVELPVIQAGTLAVGTGIFVAIACVAIVSILMRYTRSGFRAKIVGADERTARYAGFKVRRIEIGTFLVSGAVGGLAGAAVELGQVGSLSTDLSTNTGYFGIVVAVLAGGSILATIPMGVLLGGLAAAGAGLQLAGVASSATLALTGLLLILAGAADAVSRYRITFPRGRRPDAVSPVPDGLSSPGGRP